MKAWMIYGANGYTGKLIAEEAKKRGLTPMLAGRSRSKIEPLAKSLELPYRIFNLDENTHEQLQDIDVVLLTAGPFSQTSQVMINACLKAKTHYLDITGEIEVFEAAFSLSEEAKKQGITVIPGVGFDVVPTDCLAQMLKAKLPDATSLTLAFASASGPSPGTAKTMLEGMSEKGRVRINHELTPVPPAFKRRQIPFADKTRWAATIPWGDVSTAWHSTSIPNIEVYLAQPLASALLARISAPAFSLMNKEPMKGFLNAQIEKRIPGPSANTRARAKMQVWGEVKNASGESVSATMQTPEGYAFTTLSALAAVEVLLTENAVTGTSTPSLAFGPDFVFKIPSVSIDFK